MQGSLSSGLPGMSKNCPGERKRERDQDGAGTGQGAWDASEGQQQMCVGRCAAELGYTQ